MLGITVPEPQGVKASETEKKTKIPRFFLRGCEDL